MTLGTKELTHVLNLSKYIVKLLRKQRQYLVTAKKVEIKCKFYFCMINLVKPLNGSLLLVFYSQSKIEHTVNLQFNQNQCNRSLSQNVLTFFSFIYQTQFDFVKKNHTHKYIYTSTMEMHLFHQIANDVLTSKHRSTSLRFNNICKYII